MLDAPEVCGSQDRCDSFDACDADAQTGCGEEELCCNTLLGARCLADTDQCPDGTAENSCLGPALGCFAPPENELSCDARGVTGVLDVATALFEHQTRHLTRFGEPALRTWSPEGPCYDLGVQGSGLAFRDLVRGEVSLLAVEDDQVRISCADGSQQQITLASLLLALPARPLEAMCSELWVPDACQDDNACAPGEVCCAMGAGRTCLEEAACEELRPLATCQNNDACQDGEVCCLRLPAQVCDPEVCGQEQVCCTMDDQGPVMNTCGAAETCGGMMP